MKRTCKRACAATQASFGPFYRIEQLILSTVPRSEGGHFTHAQPPEPLPPIVTDANIRLLFAMQAQVLLSFRAAVANPFSSYCERGLLHPAFPGIDT